MTYDEQYDIANGIFMMFDKSSKKKILGVRHSRKKRDEMKGLFPWKKFENRTRDVFILACIYVNFTRMPSSVIQSFELLSEVESKDIQLFKDSLIQYRKYMRDDIEMLKNEYGTNIVFEEVTEKYRKSEIKWYTWYFYIVVSGYDIATLEKSRINGLLYKRIRTILLFVSFSQDSMLMVREILTENLRFN